MNNIDIKISTYSLMSHSKLLKRDLGEDVFLLLVRAFTSYVKTLYLQLIEESIYSKRYKGKWEPIDEKGYLEYLGVTPVDDILSVISDAMEVKKIGYNFFIRIDPRYKYPGSTVPLVKVLRAIEDGTSDFNARPILRKSASRIRNNLLNLWRGYLTKKGVV